MDDEEEEEALMPNGLQITSETTRLEVEPRPPGAPPRPSELVLDVAVTERHTWHGIGGRIERVRRPRRLSRVIPVLTLDVSAAAGCPAYLRGGDDCRRIIGRVMRHSLRHEEEYGWLSPARWDEAVPRGVERRIALAAAQGGGDGTTRDVRVRIGVEFEFVYSEPKALLLACVWGVGVGDGDGAAPSCPICLEEMPPGAGAATTHLPGCTHGFHRRCVFEWLVKTSTCPMCRRDMIQHLPPRYRELHDMMRPRHDVLPD